MKKVLCLVLSLLMVISTLSVGSFTAFANDMETADVLEVGSTISNVTESYRHFFKFTAEKAGNYYITTSSNGPVMEKYVNLYDSDGNSTGSDEFYGRYSFTADAGETVYLTITVYYDYYDEENPSYSISLDVDEYYEGVMEGTIGSTSYSMNYDTGDLILEGYNVDYGFDYYDLPFSNFVKNIYFEGSNIDFSIYGSFSNLESVHVDADNGYFYLPYVTNVNSLYLNSDSTFRTRYGRNLEVENLYLGNVSKDYAVNAINRLCPTNIMLTDDCVNYIIEDDALYTADKSCMLFAFSDDKNFVIPKETDEILPNALSGLTSVEKFSVESGNVSFKTIDGVLFDSYCHDLIAYPGYSSKSSYEIPDGTKTISDGAFSKAFNLEELYFPSSINTKFYSALPVYNEYQNLTLYVNVGSFAHYHAMDYNGYLNASVSVIYNDGIKELSRNEEAVSYYTLRNDGRVVRSFTPETTGYYTVKIAPNSENGNYAHYWINVYDDNEVYPISISNDWGSGEETATVKLDAGQKYYISYGVKLDNDPSYAPHGYLISIAPASDEDNSEVYRKGLYYTINKASKTASVVGPQSDRYRYDVLPKTDGCTVTSIDDYAFKSMARTVLEINLPSTIETIGNSAFADCKGLEKINIDENNPNFVFDEDGVLFNADKTELIWYPSTRKNTSYTIPSTVTKIHGGAFYGNAYLASVKIPDSVVIIGEEAFFGCALKEVKIPASVRSIEKNAFAASAIKKITFNEGLEVIGENAFDEARVKSIDIPSTVESIGDHAFRWCVYLKSAVINNTNTVFGKEVFDENTAIVSKAESTAKAYADENYYDFVDVDDAGAGSGSGSSTTTDCDHSETRTVTIPATCTENGSKITVCTNCGKFMDYEYVAPIAHSFQVVATKEATCTASGETKYACTECGKAYYEYSEIADHDFESTVVPATHTAQGYTLKTCKNCGITEKTDYTPVNDAHTFTNYVSDNNATCFKDGTKTAKCDYCNATDTIADPGTKLTHNYVVTKNVNATCTKSGVKTYTCSICGDSYTDIIDMADHTYVTSTVEPTCTSVGYTTYLCTVCGEMYNSDYQLSTAHNFKNTVVAPTCETKGYTLHSCQDCGYETKDSYVDATGHTAEDIAAIEPTCYECGYTSGKKCTVCGKFIEKPELIAKKSHEYVLKTSVPATCTSNGVKTYECKFCDSSYQEYTKATAHNYEVTTVKASTCETKGYTVNTCSICGNSYKSDYQPLADHVYNTVTVKQPTCTEKGVNRITCENCGKTYNEDIEATGHTEVTDPAVAATFKAAGKTEGSHCSVCGAVITAQKTVAKLGAPSLSGVTAGTKSFKATWKSVANIDGYQIQYSTSSKFSGATSVTVSGYKSTTKTVSKLTAKKKYYVRIRAYKTINGKKQYSAWSASKAVTTK